jgi:FkbM family methyltransferase
MESWPVLTSYAQNGEDIMLWRALRGVERGFYVDLGASHPVLDSVTKIFYEQGWSGINVEPTAGMAALLEADRPRDVTLRRLVAAAAGEAQAFFVVGDEVGLSTSSAAFAQTHAAAGWALREEMVEVSTLAEICTAHAPEKIHFLKIDVEGDEAAAIAGGDFQRFRPWIVVVEATLPNSQTPSHAAWEPMLLGQNYDFVYFDGLNRFYLAAEQAALRPAFAAPPNVFDRFERYRERVLREKLRAIKAVMEEGSVLF